MYRNINDNSLANLKHFEGKWQHGQTRTIRVPIALADEVLALAQKLDNGESVDTGESTLTNYTGNAERESHNSQMPVSHDTSDLPDTASLFNQFKAKRPKSKVTLAEFEAILEIGRGEV